MTVAGFKSLGRGLTLSGAGSALGAAFLATGAEYTSTPGAAACVSVCVRLVRFASLASRAASFSSLARPDTALASGDISSTRVLPLTVERSRASARTLTSILATARPAVLPTRDCRTVIDSTSALLTLYAGARRDDDQPVGRSKDRVEGWCARLDQDARERSLGLVFERHQSERLAACACGQFCKHAYVAHKREQHQ